MPVVQSARITASGHTERKSIMSILSSLSRIAADFSAARARYQTERTIRSLPIELQKDIGWPEASAADPSYRRGTGSWAGTK